jgi:hypothetical protein
MYSGLIFLEEWNNSAIAFIIAIFLVASFLIFLIMYGILKFIPETNIFLKRLKANSIFLFYAFHIFLFLLAVFVIFLGVSNVG